MKGKLPNQTAALISVEESEIQKLTPRKNLDYVNLTLDSEDWEIEGENFTKYNSDRKLVISGTYTNKTLLFKAKLSGLELNFTKTPYLHAVISSNTNVEICFLIEWKSPEVVTLYKRHPEFVAEIGYSPEIALLNISYPHHGERLFNQTGFITIDVAKRLSEFNLENETFSGLQIWQYSSESSLNNYETHIETLRLLDKPPYAIVEHTEGQKLPDGSVVHIIKNASLKNVISECPYLQRVFILYEMNASLDTKYTIFLLSKSNDTIFVVNVNFVFVHKALVNEIGTYIDWRKPIWLDYDFEPISTLRSELDNGDYAVVFTPLKDDEIQSISLNKVSFTYSKLPFSAFVLVQFNDDIVALMSFLVLTVAGIIPIMLTAFLCYMFRKKTLGNDTKTIKKMLIAGLILRFILAPISGYAEDTQIYSEVGALYFGSGILGAQWVSFPGFVYLGISSYFPYALLRAAGFQDFQFLALDVYSLELVFTKLPAILSDVGSFYFILKIASKFALDKKSFAAGLYFLNPLSIYLSGITGQFDSIFAFALIAFTNYLIAEYEPLKASAFAAFAAILNPVGLATIVPLLSAFLSKKTPSKMIIKGVLVTFGVIVMLMIPFIFEQESPVLLGSIERFFGAVPGEVFYGRPIYFKVYGNVLQYTIGYGLTFRFLLELLDYELGWWFYPFGAALAFLFLIFAFVYKTYRANEQQKNYDVYLGTFMLGVCCLFQFFYLTIFEQFVLWVAALLLVFYLLKPAIKILALFMMLCIANGFIYIVIWRDYLFLTSGIPHTEFQFANAWLINFGSAFLGVAYSTLLIVILAILFKIWFREELIKTQTCFQRLLNKLRA